MCVTLSSFNEDAGYARRIELVAQQPVWIGNYDEGEVTIQYSTDNPVWVPTDTDNGPAYLWTGSSWITRADEVSYNSDFSKNNYAELWFSGSFFAPAGAYIDQFDIVQPVGILTVTFRYPRVYITAPW